jgi:hypothetical protein
MSEFKTGDVMARHQVTMYPTKGQILSSDVVFSIMENESKLGELRISKGNVIWWPKGNKRKKYQISWSKLSKLLENKEFLK